VGKLSRACSSVESRAMLQARVWVFRNHVRFDSFSSVQFGSVQFSSVLFVVQLSTKLSGAKRVMIVQVLWAWRNDIRFSYLNEVNNHKKKKKSKSKRLLLIIVLSTQYGRQVPLNPLNTRHCSLSIVDLPLLVKSRSEVFPMQAMRCVSAYDRNIWCDLRVLEEAY